MAKYSGEITLAKVQDGSSGISCTGSTATYQVGTSGTVKPTGTWSTAIPAVTAGQYLWVKTTFTYSDSSTSDIYSVSYMGTNGTQGIDGKSVYMHTRFSPVASPTASQMSITPDKYIGLCVNNNSTAPTSPSSYTWTKFQGDDGQDGAQGVPGVKGADGTSYYVHFAYAESADGQTGFSTTSTAGKSYIGTCTTTSATKPTTYSSYTWAKTKGDKGDKGDTGQGIDSITPEYYVSTSNTTQAGGSWSTTMPAWAANKYCWVRNKIVYKNPASTVYTTAQLDTNWNKMNDLDSKTTVLQTTVTQEQGKLAALIKQTDTDRKNTSDKFTEVTADINGINTTIGSVQTKVDNMKVGGRNYWIQSAFDADTYKVTNTKPSGSRVPGWYADLKAVIVSDPDGNYCKLKPATIWYCAQYFNFTDGEKWTISFEARAATDNLVGKNVAINTDLLNIHPYPIGALSKDWKKYSLTFDAVGTGEERVHIRCLTGTGTDNDELHIRKIKLEKGTVATDWTPAPEDTDAQFTTINSQITTINATAAGLETKVTKAQNDATAAQSKATQAADKIGLVVQSGTNQSNLVLTPGALSAIADNINLTGKVTFTSLDTSTQNKINKTIASTSTEYANSTSQTTQPASGWSTTMPAKETGKVIWSRKKVVYVDGTSAYQDYAPISGLNGKDGKDGTNGTNGKDGANGADAITLSITSSAGISFKGTQTVTTLTCHVFRGGKELTTTEISSLGTIRWYKDTGTTSVGTGATYTVAAGTVTSATSYTAKLEG